MQLSVGHRDFIWNVAGTFFRLGASFLLLPFLLAYLDDSTLGLWYVFLSVNSFVILFQAGFVPTFARNVSYCWSGARRISKNGLDRSDFDEDEMDFALFACIVRASKLIYCIIAVVAGVLLLTAGTAYIVHIADSVSWESYLVSWIIFCLAVFLNMFFSYYESLLRGVGDFPDVNKATIISSLCYLIPAALMLSSGLGLISCAVAFCLQGVSFRILCRRAFLRYKGVGKILHDVGTPPKVRTREVVRAVIPNAVRDSIVSFANYAVTTANTVLCSLFLDLSQTGSYSILLQLVGAAASLATVILTTNQPPLQSAFARGDKELERRLTGETAVGYVLVYALCSAGIALVLVPLIVLIRPTFVCDWLLLALMMSYVFLWKQHSMGATFITNTNELPFVRAFVVSSVAGIALTSVLLAFTDVGIYGLVLGQAISQLVYNNWKWPREAAKRLNTTYPALLFEGLSSLTKKARDLIVVKRTGEGGGA